MGYGHGSSLARVTVLFKPQIAVPFLRSDPLWVIVVGADKMCWIHGRRHLLETFCWVLNGSIAAFDR